MLMCTRVILDAVSWIAVVMVFTSGVGVAFTILLPGETYGYDRAFFRPFWGVVGAFDATAIDDYFEMDDSTNALRETITGLLFISSFVTTILLVNLLIAQVSNTYEAMKAESIQLWCVGARRSVIASTWHISKNSRQGTLNQSYTSGCEL